MYVSLRRRATCGFRSDHLKRRASAYTSIRAAPTVRSSSSGGEGALRYLMNPAVQYRDISVFSTWSQRRRSFTPSQLRSPLQIYHHRWCDTVTMAHAKETEEESYSLPSTKLPPRSTTVSDTC